MNIPNSAWTLFSSISQAADSRRENSPFYNVGTKLCERGISRPIVNKDDISHRN
jgi:hypothetical protein